MPHEENSNEVGVGLIPDVAFSEYVEQLILSYLDDNEILTYAGVDQEIWKYRLEEEINRRQGCVTIYTWLEGDSSLAVRKTQTDKTVVANSGHSALRTWGGGEKDKGVYASFYPGNCITEHRIPSCREAVPHFHTLNQERATLERAIPINLYGLDIEAINKAFYALRDEDMHSHESWSLRYNCSDVVLFLLGEGKFFEKVDVDYLGSTAVFSVSIILSTFLRAYFEYLFKHIKLRSLIASTATDSANLYSALLSANPDMEPEALDIVEKALLDATTSEFSERWQTISKRSLVTLFLPQIISSLITPQMAFKHPVLFVQGAQIAIALYSGLINAPITSGAVYTLSHYVHAKKYKPKHTKVKNMAISHAAKAGIFLTLEPVAIYGIKLLLKWCTSKKPDKMLGRDIAHHTMGSSLLNLCGINLFSLGSNLHHSKVVGLLNPINATVDTNPTSGSLAIRLANPKGKDILSSLFLVSYPLILLGGSYLAMRYFYDTTITPKHVLKIVKEAQPRLTVQEDKPKKKEHSSQPISPKTNWLKYGVGLAVGLTALGIFAYKSNKNTSVSSNQNSNTIQFNF